MREPSLQAIEVPAALSPASLIALRERLEAIEGGVVVLRGAGEAFCRGIDFSALRDLAPDEEERALLDFEACLCRLRRAPAPVIAVVEGSALGGGLGLAAAADVLIAAADARFGLPEVLFGLYPAMVLAALEERVPAQKLRRLALEGASVDAAAALAMGLADEVSPEPDRALARWVRVLSRASAEGARALKSHPPGVARFERAVAAGRERTQAALRDPRVRARIDRFLADEALPWGDAR